MRYQLVTYWLSSLCAGTLLGAGLNFDVARNKLVELRRHDSLKFEISIPKKSYFLGELIPVTLSFSDSKDTRKYAAWAGEYDRSGRVPMTFVVEGPAESHCDPLATYFESPWLNIGGPGYEVKLGQYDQVFNLNEWVRFDRPGIYRFYSVSSRVCEVMDNRWQGVELVSQIVEVEIRAPTEEELANTFRMAVSGSASFDRFGSSDKAINESLDRLRHLDTPASRHHLLKLFGDCDELERWAKFGLMGSRDNDACILLLESGIDDPDVGVTGPYLQCLAHLRLNRERSKSTPSQSKAVCEIDHLGDCNDWKRLLIAFEKKAGRAKVVCAHAFCGLLRSDFERDRHEAEAKASGTILLNAVVDRLDHEAIISKIRLPLAAAFDRLATTEQTWLLREVWPIARCPELLPQLRKIIEATSQDRDDSRHSGLLSLAVLRLMDLDPAFGKSLVLSDVRKLRPHYSLEVLCSMADEDLKRELPILTLNLGSKEPVDREKIAGIINHLADPSAFDVVREIYLLGEGEWFCLAQVHCLCYFIKVRRAEGLKMAFRAIYLREKRHTRCYTSTVTDVLAAQYDPDVETKLLMALSVENEPDVILDMVSVALEHGTEAVITPLLDVIGRLSPKEVVHESSYRSEGGVRADVVRRMIYAASRNTHFPGKRKRWKLSAEHRERLKASLVTEDEVELFTNLVLDE